MFYWIFSLSQVSMFHSDLLYESTFQYCFWSRILPIPDYTWLIFFHEIAARKLFSDSVFWIQQREDKRWNIRFSFHLRIQHISSESTWHYRVGGKSNWTCWSFHLGSSIFETSKWNWEYHFTMNQYASATCSYFRVGKGSSIPTV